LFLRSLREQSGYSLVEVMVSIIILAIAILPMAGMFDMGLHSATASGKYDKARALANLKMEEAKSRPFATVKDNFPQTGNGTPYTTVNWINGPSGFGGFQYRVEKQFMTQPAQAPTEPFFFSTSGQPTGLIRVTVIVQWGDGNTYTTYGLVGK
jgi:prepilin-type N-terminal cleavage/methylation domain-containing protein